MGEQVASPGMEHTDHPETASEEAGIQGQGLQRLCGGAKQDVALSRCAAVFPSFPRLPSSDSSQGCLSLTE